MIRILTLEFFFVLVCNPDGGGSAISSMLAKAQASALANAEQQNSSPSPTTILKTVNSSGSYMCSITRSNIEMQSPSPVVHYHEPATTPQSLLTQIPQEQNNMMQHRNNNLTCLKDRHHTNQYDFDENDENSNQQNQYQYHNSFNNYTQNQHQVLSETQQQADQHTIELRMNNLGNERQDTE